MRKYIGNSSTIMGIGIGIIITCLIMIFTQNSFYTDYKIEKRARELGMIYSEEIRAIEKNTIGGNEK